MKPPIIVIPGTFWKDLPAWAATYSHSNKPMQAIARIFGATPIIFDWSGENSPAARHAASVRLAALVERMAPLVHLLGFSHGGNIASEAAAHPTVNVDLLVTIATPVTGNYRTGGARRHIHLYSPQDRLQVLGGEGPLGLPTRAEREFPGATNIAIQGIQSSAFSGSHGNILWSDETWRIIETLH